MAAPPHTRVGIPADLDAIAAIDPMTRDDTARRSQVAGWLATGACHVATREGDVVGFAVLTQNFFHSPFVELVFVVAAARRDGIATALLRHCIELVRPAAKLWTSTNTSNAPMRALLPRLGFIHSGTVENLDEGDPELIYLLRLPQAR